MQLNTEYHIWEAAAQDEARPVLHAVRFLLDPAYGPENHEHALAMAADGYCLVIVPCLAGPDDVLPQTVNIDALIKAHKWVKPSKRDETWSFFLTAEGLSAAGVNTPKDQAYIDGTYPDLFTFSDSISRPLDRGTPFQAGESLAFDFEIMTAVRKALGSRLLRLSVRHRASPFLIELQNTNQGWPQAPYAIQMPMHYGGPNDYQKSIDRFDQHQAALKAKTQPIEEEVTA